MNPQEKQYLIEWLETVNQATTKLIGQLKPTEKPDLTVLMKSFFYEREYKVTDFAKIIGCTEKTVYSMIKRNEVGIKEKRIRGRKIMFVLASNEKINELKTLYKD